MKRSSATSGYLVKKSDTSNGYRLWITSSGAVQFDVLFNGTTKTVTSATTIPLNTWKHVVARYNGSKLRVFIDGTTDRAKTTATGSLAATTEALWLGYYDAANHHFHGYLDDVSIYDRSLSNGEIAKLSNKRAGRYEYHHTNALGSNIIMTDDSKNVDARYYYDAFGAVRSETGTSGNTRKFTGKEYESDVKLYHFPGRPIGYDPYIGRFNQRDPAGDGINWYAYANNNPLAFIDPTGLRALSALESYAVDMVFHGSISADELDITIEHLVDSKGRPTIRGRYLGFEDGKYKFAIDPDFYAGLSADSTLSDAFDSNGSLRADVTTALGIVIHEATHAWQRKYNRFRGRSPWRYAPMTTSVYRFNRHELTTLNLGMEQHASATQSYFQIAWQLSWGRTVVDLITDWKFDEYGKQVISVQDAHSALSWFQPLITQYYLVTWGSIKIQ